MSLKSDEINLGYTGIKPVDPFEQAMKVPEYTGKSVSYYKLHIAKPVSGQHAYMAECQDIIEALGMDFNEGNAFKALWRRAAARTLGLAKKGYDGGLYDAEKVVFAGQRMVALSGKDNGF